MMPQLNSIWCHSWTLYDATWCHSWTLYSIFNGHYMMPNRLTNGRQIVTHSLVLTLISLRPYMVSEKQSFIQNVTQFFKTSVIPLFCHSFLWDHIWCQVYGILYQIWHHMFFILRFLYTTVTLCTMHYALCTMHYILRLHYTLFIQKLIYNLCFIYE